MQKKIATITAKTNRADHFARQALKLPRMDPNQAGTIFIIPAFVRLMARVPLLNPLKLTCIGTNLPTYS